MRDASLSVHVFSISEKSWCLPLWRLRPSGLQAYRPPGFSALKNAMAMPPLALTPEVRVAPAPGVRMGGWFGFP